MCSLPKQDIFVFDIKAASGRTSITATFQEGGRGRRVWKEEVGRVRMGKQYVSLPKVEPTCSSSVTPIQPKLKRSS